MIYQQNMPNREVYLTHKLFITRDGHWSTQSKFSIADVI